VFNSNLQGIRLRGRQNTHGGIVYKQILRVINTDINTCKITIRERERSKTPDWEKSIEEASVRIGL
jgi:hypothetical protein